MLALLENITNDINASEGVAGSRMTPRMAHSLGRILATTVPSLRADARELVDACVMRGWGMGKNGEMSTVGIHRVLRGEDSAYDVERGGKPSVYGAFVLGLVQPTLPRDVVDPTIPHPLTRSSMSTFECFVALVATPPPAPTSTAKAAAATATKPKKNYGAVGTLRQHVRLVKTMPDYAARKFALDTYHAALDEAVHLAGDATEFPLRFHDLKTAFMQSPVFNGFKDDVKAAAQDVYLKCKSWVEYQRLLKQQQPLPDAATAAEAADGDDPMASARKKRRTAAVVAADASKSGSDQDQEE
jgi:hypothetical protein